MIKQKNSVPKSHTHSYQVMTLPVYNKNLIDWQ